MEDIELDFEHLNQLRQECIDSLYLCAENVTKYLDNNKDDQINTLKKCLQSYIVSEAQQENDIETFDTIINTIDSSNVNELESLFSRLRGNPNVNVDRDPRMIEFMKRIQLNGKTVPQNLNESDIAITESNNSPVIDPLTKKPIEDPVQNTKCGHVYEREKILQHINRNARARCPVAACRIQEPLRKENLISVTKHIPQIFEDNTEDESNSELSQEY